MKLKRFINTLILNVSSDFMTLPRLNPRQLEIGDRFWYKNGGPYEVTRKVIENYDQRRVVTRIVGKGYDEKLTLQTFQEIYREDVIVDLSTWLKRRLN